MEIDTETQHNFMNLPKVIQNSEKTLINEEDRTADNLMSLEIIKLKILDEIEVFNLAAKEKGEKIPFSNADKREVEAKRIIKEKHSVLISNIENSKKYIKFMRIDIDFLKRMFRAHEIRSRTE